MLIAFADVTGAWRCRRSTSPPSSPPARSTWCPPRCARPRRWTCRRACRSGCSPACGWSTPASRRSACSPPSRRSRRPAACSSILPLGVLLLILARDRSARIAQAHRRLEQVFTDPLTQLGNRRLLAGDLREQLDAATERPAGGADALRPRRLQALQRHLRPRGRRRAAGAAGREAGRGRRARRHGLPARRRRVLRAASRRARTSWTRKLSAAADALTESGEEFSVTASYGVTLLPHESDDPDHAIQLADERMYASKRGRNAGAREQARDVLMRSMDVREPALHEHSGDVAALAGRIGRRLGMDAEDVDITVRAAELHDLGKVGVPDAILDKAAALDAGEWEFMRQHTILGERILNAAPGAAPGGTDRPRDPRALGRRRLPGRARRRADPAERAHRRGLRRVRGHGHRPRVPRARSGMSRPAASCGARPAGSSTRSWSRRSWASSRPPGPTRRGTAAPKDSEAGPWTR